MKHFKLLLALALSTTLFFTSCKEDPIENPKTILGKKASEFNSEVPDAWAAHSLDLVKTTTGYTPPVTSRNLAYMNIAMYESVIIGSDTYKTMGGQLNGLKALPTPEYGLEYHIPAVANATMAKMSTFFFPASNAKKAKFDSIALIKSYFDKKFLSENVSQAVLDRSILFGEKMAQAIIDWSKEDIIGTDAYNKNFPVSYTVPSGVGYWEPTSAQLIPMQPYWGSIRSFIPKSIETAQPVAPPTFSTSTTSDMYNFALQVVNAKKNITPEQTVIAKYWADGGGTVSPPGHSLAITRQLVGERKLALDRAAEAYCKSTIAVADAFIACWKCKYVYNLMRPVTYIKKNIDPTWTPLIATPPFPEYISGHSTQSGALAYILTDLFGDVAFTDRTNENRKDIDGTPRKYDSFMKMANEAAISRLYGGIHYDFGNNNGLGTGIKIGKALDNIKFK
jgi:hypothetical protein